MVKQELFCLSYVYMPECLDHRRYSVNICRRLDWRITTTTNRQLVYHSMFNFGTQFLMETLGTTICSYPRSLPANFLHPPRLILPTTNLITFVFKAHQQSAISHSKSLSWSDQILVLWLYQVVLYCCLSSHHSPRALRPSSTKCCTIPQTLLGLGPHYASIQKWSCFSKNF